MQSRLVGAAGTAGELISASIEKPIPRWCLGGGGGGSRLSGNGSIPRMANDTGLRWGLKLPTGALAHSLALPHHHALWPTPPALLRPAVDASNRGRSLAEDRLFRPRHRPPRPRATDVGGARWENARDGVLSHALPTLPGALPGPLDSTRGLVRSLVARSRAGISIHSSGFL